MFALTYKDNKKYPTGMISPPFPTKEEAIAMIPKYKAKGWVANIIMVDAPKPLSKEEHEQLEKTQRFLNKITGAFQ